MNITYGNREGQYFTQWRFDLLAELLQKVQEGPIPGQSETVEVANVEIWYDAREDYHRLKFDAQGHHVEVRLYKVFACTIDKAEGWVGCPQRLIWDYAAYLRKELKDTPHVA